MLAAALTGPWLATASAAACQSWTSGQPPSPGTVDNELGGVAVLSACDAWAAGTARSSGPGQTLIEHWNGSAWTVVPSPSPGTTGNMRRRSGWEFCGAGRPVAEGRSGADGACPGWWLVTTMVA